MKKLLLTTALVASTVATSAQAESGFFAGVYGGFTALNSRTDGQFGVITNPPQQPNSVYPTTIGGNGGQGGLQLGYEHAFEGGFVAALDLFGQFGSATAEHREGGANNTLTASLKQKYAFGVAARLGYMFDTTLAYLKVGYIHSRFDAVQTVSVLLPAPAGLTPFSQTTKLNANGFLVGIGADMPVGEMITVGFSYDYSIYGRKTADHRFTTVAPGPVNQNNAHVTQFRPRTHAINVVLKYKF